MINFCEVCGQRLNTKTTHQHVKCRNRKRLAEQKELMKTCECSTYNDCYESKCICDCHSSKMKIKKECLDEQIIASYKQGQIKAYKKCLGLLDEEFTTFDNYSSHEVIQIRARIEKELKELE